MRLLILTLFLISFQVLAQNLPVEIPYDSMTGCQRHFAGWARIEKVQIKAFAEAFPNSIWEGTLDDRVVRLQEKWPNNIKVVEEVKFQFKNNEGVVTSHQKKSVIVISTKNLSAEDVASLTQDYTDAMSWLTVSFPLKESGSHLYTRLGNKELNYYDAFFREKYELDLDSEIIEPIVHLSPEEQFRLNTYVKNISKDRDKVLGDNSYDGAGNAQGKLTNNKPTTDCDGHNCTSWMGLAPIGDENEFLVKMVGAGKSWNIHTNPGWWLKTLTAISPIERVPYVVLFSPKSLAELTNSQGKVKKNKLFKWNFSVE
ncbi:MAG: hypothetical protein ACOYL6_12620 [Bacteriovoracaceae bacterium]